MKIKAKYAALPITDTAVPFVVEVLDPVQLLPQTILVTSASYSNQNGWRTDSTLDVLKREIHNMLVTLGEVGIESVELIECTLLLAEKNQDYSKLDKAIKSE